MKKAIKIIVQTLPYVFFALAVILILQIVFAIKDSRQPTVLGYSLSFVLTPSMEPAIDAGDLIVSRSVQPEDLEVGDIITFRADIPVGSSTREESITHRIVEVQVIDGTYYFTTKGDNNSVTYAWETAISEERVVSQYRGKSAFLGDIYQAVFTGENRFSYLYAIAIVLFLAIAFTEMLNIIREISNHKKAEELKQKEAMIQEELAKLRAEHSESIASQAEDTNA
jgi:signal peptidase I